ncbi:unnamed protein product [Citrullus colocynthis]|uniref:Secreted protein n=1 Tax=Citrullus colocynthis TaxID=252529 RepID=A0ABP0XQ01_9ROSI
MLFLLVFQWARVFSPTYADGHLGSFDFRVHQVSRFGHREWSIVKGLDPLSQTNSSQSQSLVMVPGV